jgi:sec-independent protein translocase protein TatA
MGLFDNPWHILIVLLVLVLLFGSAKLPKAAKSMGEAMRIFKKEAQKLHDEDDASATQVQSASTPQVAAAQPPAAQPAAAQQAAAQPAAVPQPAAEQPGTQEQMDALQRQMDALQQEMAAQQGTPPTNQPG